MAVARLFAQVVGDGEGAKGQVADDCGISASRVSQMVSGQASIALEYLIFMKPEHGRELLGAVAEAMGYRLVPVDAELAHVRPAEVLHSMLGIVQENTDAAADGVYTRAEATPLRRLVDTGIERLEALRARLLDAEANGVAPVTGVGCGPQRGAAC